jgi:hypothetical protein
MKIKNLIIATSFLALPFMSFAQSGDTSLLLNADITKGVVIEGDSLPVGISLGETFGEIEATLDAINEFDLNERFCEGLTCFYTARDDQGDELGQVRVLFRFDRTTQQFNAIRMTYTFEDWETTRGLSLRELENDIQTQEELLDIYPNGLALLTDFDGRRVASVFDVFAGFNARSIATPTTRTLEGSITSPRGR